MKSMVGQISGKGIGYALVAMFALAAAQSAKAEWWGFKGSATSPSYWNEKKNWYISGGDWNNFETATLQNVHINPHPAAADIFVSGWDKVITFQANSTLNAAMLKFCAGSVSDPIVFVAEDPGCGITCSGYFQGLASDNAPAPCLEIRSGTYRFTYLDIGTTSGKTNTVVVNGGTLKTTSSYARIGNVGCGVLTVKAGSFDNLESGNKNLTLGQASGSSGTLNIAGGTAVIGGYIALNYASGANKSAINITDGGVLTVNNIYLRYAGASGGTIMVDGGTLRAYANNATFLPAFSDAAKFHVYAGANGATIDANTHSVTIGAAIENKSGEAGVVTFTGGGTIALSGTPSYTGGTTNVAGTVLSLTPAAKNVIVDHPIAVVIPESGATDGTVVFEVTGGGTFTQAEVDAMVVTGTDAERYTLVLAENGAKVAISDTLAGEYVWCGSAEDSWRTDDNWSKNGMSGNWYDSTAAVFENAGDSATVDADVTAASITFRENATILAGGGTLSPGTVVVSNGVSATINAPTAGALVKDGPGTLTLSQSRAAQTDMLDGTLVLTGSGTAIDKSSLALGSVEADKDVAIRFENGAALTFNVQADHAFGVVPGKTTVIDKDGGDWNVGWNLVLSGAANATTRFYHRGGTMDLPRYVRLGYNTGSNGGEVYFEISGGMVTNSLSTGQGFMDIGTFGAPGFRSVLSVKSSGTFGAQGNVVVGNNGAGTLEVDGGTVVAANAAIMLCFGPGNHVGEDCAIHISNGGLLVARVIQYGESASSHGAANATITFDDGTLKASADGTLVLADDKLTVTVASGGGTIDASGKTVTIEEELSGEGGMTYMGGGVVALSVAPAYSGQTTVDIGTLLVVPAAINGEDIRFAIPEEGLATGTYKVIEVAGEGAFQDDVLDSVEKPGDANVHFFLANGNREVWCIYSDNEEDGIWIGGASNSLNDGENWLSGCVPTGGTAFIGSATDVELENPEGSGFGATGIVIRACSANVTISGEGFSDVRQVVNNSESMAEFKNAVDFAPYVDVIQNPGAVKFTGGATGTQLARATDIHGTYNFTTTDSLVEQGGTVVKGDGVYRLLGGTFFKHNGDFSVEAGGKAEVGGAKINRSSEARLLDEFNGEFKVNGEFHVSASGASGFISHYLANSGTGTFIANKIRVITNAALVPRSRTVIGGGGIIRGNGYIRVYNSGSHEFGSCADWTMYHDSLGNTATASPVFYKHKSAGSPTRLTFNTTDYYDDAVGRKITCEAPISAEDADSATNFFVTVKGKGRFVFANTSDGNIFSGGLKVQDSATVEVMPNAWPGKGTVSVGAKATLKVAGSGTVTIGDSLTLADGATLAFNFSAADSAPTLAMAEGKGVGLGSGKKVNVDISLSPGVGRIKAGTYALATGAGDMFKGAKLTFTGHRQKGMTVVVDDDGNVVLKVVPGAVIIVK